MAPHYVRKTSKRRYLDKALNIKKMYEDYKRNQEKNGLAPATQACDRNIFCGEYNLSFHRPKKKFVLYM